MKTAEKLNDIGQRIYWSIEHGRAGEVISELQAIQLDAMQEGMRRAARLVLDSDTILSAAEQLTEKDL
jgi:hypothetical protein